MNDSVTNILVVGIYWSGSGAVVDFLKDHPSCLTPVGEFTDLKRGGRIVSALTAATTTEARRINRMMWLETVAARLPGALLQQIRGKSPERLPLKKQVVHNRLKLQALKEHRRFLKDGGDHRDSAPWNRWVRTMGSRYAADRQSIVWNQPLWIGRHEMLCMEVFEPCKLVVVHRDPADQIAEVYRQGKLGKAKSDPIFQGDRSDPVKFLLDGITRKLERLVELRQQLDNTRLLTVSFEDFVLDHETEAARLYRFLDLAPHPKTGRHFRPEESAGNIGISGDSGVSEQLDRHSDKLDYMRSLRETLNPSAREIT